MIERLAARVTLDFVLPQIMIDFLATEYGTLLPELVGFSQSV